MLPPYVIGCTAREVVTWEGHVVVVMYKNKWAGEKSVYVASARVSENLTLFCCESKLSVHVRCSARWLPSDLLVWLLITCMWGMVISPDMHYCGFFLHQTNQSSFTDYSWDIIIIWSGRLWVFCVWGNCCLVFPQFVRIFSLPEGFPYTLVFPWWSVGPLLQNVVMLALPQ